jgi:RimJ/RimL family protein N-acetyltransferase
MSAEVTLRISQPLRTERLVLRTLTEDDLDDVYAYASRPDVIRYLPWPMRDRAGVKAHLATRLGTTLDNDGDVLVLGVEFPAQSGVRAQIIGDITLVLKSAEHRQAEIGWVLNPDFQGEGYATEAASRILTLAFDDLGAHRVIAQLDPRNAGSVALCYRLGMRHEAHFVHDQIFKGSWADTAIYAILDVEWNARNAIDGL